MCPQNSKGEAPYCYDADLLGEQVNPPGGDTIHGTLKIATRAGVPGSALQVFEHALNWAAD